MNNIALIVFFFICAASAFAGPDEYARDAAKAKAEADHSVKKHCVPMTDKAKRDKCTADAKATLDGVLKALKKDNNVK